MDCTTYRYNSSKQKDFYFALFSDLHADSPSFARKAFIADADKYAALGARFLFNGDVFDAILPTDRKRYTRANDSSCEDAQINDRLENVFNLLSPYVDLIDFIGIGNHEASIVKYDHVDLVAFLTVKLNAIRDKKLAPIQRGGYQGFLCLRFSENGKSNSRSYIVYREHGKGGAAPVTKGVINIQRLHTTYVADLYWLGHTHTDIVDKTPWTIYPDRNGNIIRKQKRSVITAGYQGCFEQRNLKKDDDYYRTGYPEENFLIPSGQGSALLHVTAPKSHHELLQAEITS
jgi:hypothetical protein